MLLYRRSVYVQNYHYSPLLLLLAKPLRDLSVRVHLYCQANRWFAYSNYSIDSLAEDVLPLRRYCVVFCCFLLFYLWIYSSTKYWNSLTKKAKTPRGTNCLCTEVMKLHHQARNSGCKMFHSYNSTPSSSYCRK